MAKLAIKAGSTSQTVDIFIQDSTVTDGSGKTGLVYNTSGLTAYYNFPGGSSTAITLATLSSATTAYSSGGFKEIDSTNQKGHYRFDIPNACLASGNGRSCKIVFQGTGIVPCPIEIELTGWDNQKTINDNISLRSSTAQSGNTASIKLDSGASTVNNFYNGLLILITGGTGSGQVRTISSYNGSSKTANVDRNFVTAPDNTSTFAILPNNTAALNSNLQVTANVSQAVIRSGTAQAGSTNTVTLDSGASSTSNIYNNSLVTITSGTGAGQSRTITAYNGSTKVATVSQNWTTTPDNTSAFNIIASTTPSQFSDQGVAQAATSSSITLQSTASSVDSIYVGSLVTILSGTGAGQTSQITAYVGSTKVATISPNWSVTPDSTSSYAVIPTASNDSGSSTSINVNTINGITPNIDSSGRVLLQPTQTGVTIPTVTTITNGVTVTTNNDKTGYSLTQAFPTNFSSLAINSGDGGVTIHTNNDKTGYTLSDDSTITTDLNNILAKTNLLTFDGSNNIHSILADGVAHGGTPSSSTATFALKQFNVTNPSGDAIIGNSISSGHGAWFSGDVAGLRGTGLGSGGAGLELDGSQFGAALFAFGPSTNGPTVQLQSNADGDLLVFTPTNGSSINIGGGSDSPAIKITGPYTTPGPVILIDATLSVTGLNGGPGLEINVGGSNTSAISLTPGSGGKAIINTLTSNPVEVTLADAVTHGGSTAKLDLQQLVIDNPTDNAVNINSGNAEGSAIAITSSGSGLSIASTQFSLYAQSTNTSCVVIDGAGGNGLQISGSQNALDIYGTQSGIYCQGNNAPGFLIYGGGSTPGLSIFGGQSGGPAVQLDGGTTGVGLQINGGSTSGHAIAITSNSHGIDIEAGDWAIYVQGSNAAYLHGTSGVGVDIQGASDALTISTSGGIGVNITGHTDGIKIDGGDGAKDIHLIGSGSIWDGVNNRLISVYNSGVSFPTNFDLLNIDGSGNVSIAQTFPTNFTNLSIDLASGGVAVKTNLDKTGYTVSTNQDKSGYTLTSTYNPPTGWSSLSISGGSVSVFANADKTGYALSSSGLNALSTTVPSGVPTSLVGKINQIWSYIFGRTARDDTAKTITMLDNSNTVLTTQTYTVSGNNQTKSEAS